MITLEYIRDFLSSIGIDDCVDGNLHLNDLGLDSLSLVELLGKIEEDYNKFVPLTKINGNQTLSDFLKMLNEL